MSKIFLFFGLGLVSVWNTITLIYGTYTVLGNGTLQIIISILFGILITAFLLSSIQILRNSDEDFVTVGAKVLWFLALLYNIYCTFLGNWSLLLNNNTDNSLASVILTIGVTIFITSSPIAISQLLIEYKD